MMANKKLPQKEIILVVEDNPDHMQLATTILNYANYRILEAINGDEGLRIAKEHLPDLILMDIRLPVMDGFEVVKKLKADPKTADIGVIVLTAFNDAENREKAKCAGCDGFVEKPITPYFLETEFKRVLKEKKKKQKPR